MECRRMALVILIKRYGFSADLQPPCDWPASASCVSKYHRSTLFRQIIVILLVLLGPPLLRGCFHLGLGLHIKLQNGYGSAGRPPGDGLRRRHER